MPMELPAGTVEIGANAYLFPSPAGAGVTDCFIIAHGGTTYARDARFKVPAGCTVNFFTGAGSSFKMDQGPIEGFRVMAGRNQGGPPPIQRTNQFTEGASCRDYILAKAVGKHYEADPDGNTYIGINRGLNELAGPHAGLQWLPHYISIRNRTSWFRDTNIWLSKLIEQIRAYDSTIVNFYCSHCRGVLRGESEVTNLKTVGNQGLQ
jgi:hypothetical protein